MSEETKTKEQIPAAPDPVAILEGVINEQGEAIKKLQAEISAMTAKNSVTVVDASVKKKDIIYLDGETSYKVTTPRFQVPSEDEKQKGILVQIDLTNANQKELSAAFKKYDWAFKKIN